MPQRYVDFIQPQEGITPVPEGYIDNYINMKEMLHNRRNELIYLHFTHKGITSAIEVLKKVL